MECKRRTATKRRIINNAESDRARAAHARNTFQLFTSNSCAVDGDDVGATSSLTSARSTCLPVVTSLCVRRADGDNDISIRKFAATYDRRRQSVQRHARFTYLLLTDEQGETNQN